MAMPSGGRGMSISYRRDPAFRVAKAKAGDVHQVENAAGAPAPLSIAPWRATERVPAPPEVKVVETCTKSFIAGSSPMPMSLAPPPEAEVGMPEVTPRSMVLVDACVPAAMAKLTALSN